MKQSSAAEEKRSKASFSVKEAPVNDLAVALLSHYFWSSVKIKQQTINTAETSANMICMELSISVWEL